MITDLLITLSGLKNRSIPGRSPRPLIGAETKMGRTRRRSFPKKDGSPIDSGLDARLRLLAVGQLDRENQDRLFIELAKDPVLVGRLAEHLRAPTE
jgi:hypothetical protein